MGSVCQFADGKLHVSIILGVLLQHCFLTCDAFQVMFHEHIGFKGASRELDVTRCHNLFNLNFNDRTSSIVTSECTIIYSDMCCQGKSKKLLSSSENLDDIDFNDKITSVSPCGDYYSSAPHQIHETWSGHGQIMTRVAQGIDTAIYYNDDVQRTGLRSHSEYIRKLWLYVKSTYGEFGPENSRLFAFFHANVPTSLYGFNSLQSYFDISSECRNLVDFVGKRENAWSTSLNGTDELDEVTHEVAHLVEWGSKSVHGSPTYQLWGDDVWPEIFTFDVYYSLDQHLDKERWFSHVQNSKHDLPTPNTYWFRDWFFPIYVRYGGAQVLNNYFEMLAKHFPRKENGWEYARDITLGEFVHFFSGAAKTDLKKYATKAFIWDNYKEWELLQAKKNFPGIIY